MKEYTASEVASMLGIKPTTLSNWFRQHTDDLAHIQDHIRETAKFNFYDILAIKEICRLRNQPLPDEVQKQFDRQNLREALDKLKEKYNIVTVDDALDVIFQLRKKIVDYKNQVDALQDLLETRSDDIKDWQNVVKHRQEELSMLLERALNVLEAKGYPDIRKDVENLSYKEEETFDPRLFDTDI